MLKSKEHYDLMASFDKEYKTLRLDKEPKDSWRKGRIYQDGLVNRLFDAFRKGYSLGKVV